MKLRWLKYILLFLFVLILGGGVYIYNYAMARLAPRPSMLDSPTTFIGFNHIGISVANLEQMVAFYQSATEYEIIKRYTIQNNASANILFGQDSVSFETVILKGPNMLLELTQFDQPFDSTRSRMPFYGPGMTHTCYQGPADQPVYDKFKAAGADILSRGTGPVEVGGGRVSYAYGYDPEGNMMELEHMPDILIRMSIGKKWSIDHPIWMTQVALISHDVDRLKDYYQEVLEIEPYRVNSYGANPFMDAIVDYDNVTSKAVWFGMDTQGKKLEMMQFTHPVTPQSKTPRRLTDLGYSFSFEVADIQREYERLKNKGVNLISSPQKLEDFWVVYAQDPDGNIYSLRQALSKDSPLSLKNMEG